MIVMQDKTSEKKNIIIILRFPSLCFYRETLISFFFFSLLESTFSAYFSWPSFMSLRQEKVDLYSQFVDSLSPLFDSMVPIVLFLVVWFQIDLNYLKRVFFRSTFRLFVLFEFFFYMEVLHSCWILLEGCFNLLNLEEKCYLEILTMPSLIFGRLSLDPSPFCLISLRSIESLDRILYYVLLQLISADSHKAYK